MTFDGISNRMYGTKKMTSATLYLLPSSLSSFERPKTLALAMLTLYLSAYTYQIDDRRHTDLRKPAGT